MILKKCTKCGSKNSHDKFYKNRSTNDGLTQWCKTCMQRLNSENRKKGMGSYSHAKARCTKKHEPGYENYGGRGIEFKFKTFKELIDSIGDRPAGYSIDRINVNGHYEHGNVQWATHAEQQSNRRNNKLSHDDKKKIKTLRQSGISGIKIGRMFGVTHQTIYKITNV